MAKSPEKKVEKEVEDAIFTQPEEKVIDPVRGVETQETAPAKETGLGTSSKKETVTLDLDQFNSFMERLSDLENTALVSNRGAEDVFNPLAIVTADHKANVCYLEDELFVGYKVKLRPDKSETYTWLAKDPASGEMRTYCTVLLDDGNGKVREETMDYIQFMQSAIPVEATIKERKDIGELKEHGLVNQVVWSGNGMVDTGKKVMSGVKEQKFVFKIDINGRIVEMPQNAINIK